MALIDKLKKIFTSGNDVMIKEVKVKEEDIEKFIKNEVYMLNKRDEELKNSIKEIIFNFDKDITVLVNTLEKVDLVERKEDERIKLIVLKNRENYILLLKKTIQDLKKIQAKDSKDYFEKIYPLIIEFDKATVITQQKATYLIGEEMAKVGSAISVFIKSLEAKKRDNLHFLEEINHIKHSEKLYEKINDCEKNKMHLIKEIKDNEQEIKGMEQEIIKYDLELESIKEKEEYKRDLKEKEERKNKINDLNKELDRIKGMIDFKSLLRIYHKDEKKTTEIKSYQNEFRYSLEKDDGIKIIDFTKEALGQNLSMISDIKNSLIKLSNNPQSPIEIKINQLNESIKKKENEKSAKENENAELNNKIRKLENKKKEEILQLKETLKKRNIILEI